MWQMFGAMSRTTWQPPSLNTELQWYVLNDTVMGGRSSSSIGVEPAGLVFRGNINTRGGGFASARSTGGALDQVLDGATALKVRCRGDGKRYMITLRTGSDESLAYCHDVLAQGDVEVVLPFDAFIASWRGQPRRAAPLRGSDIQSVGVLLSLRSMDGSPNREFGDGPFEFFLRDVAAISAQQPQAALVDSLTEPVRVLGTTDEARIKDAIAQGAPAWNAGNRARTAEIYTEVCRVSFDPRLKQALEQVERFRCDVESTGWVLRCAMDEVLEPSGKGNWALNSAIQKGVPFFNQGLPAVCASIYARAASTHDDPLVQRALGKAQQQRDPAAAAWTLRKAFDIVLRDSLLGA